MSWDSAPERATTVCATGSALIQRPAWQQGRWRPHVAIGASILFHAIVLGAGGYMGTRLPAPAMPSATLAVALMPGTAGETAPPHTAQSTARDTPAPPQPAATGTRRHTVEAAPSGSSGSANLAGSAKASGSSGTTGVSIPASYAAGNRKPVYPLLSRRQEEEGTVLLRVLVKTDGTAGTVQIKQSSGYPLLDASALAAVKHWRFRPATQNQSPVPEWYQLAIPFKLES